MPAYLAGRDMEVILHAFPELAPAAPRPAGRRYYSRKDIEQNRAARREKYAAIRRDFDARMSERAIERERAASTEEDPPPLSCAHPAHIVSIATCSPRGLAPPR